MRTFGSWCLGLVLLAGPVGAAEPVGRVVHETWDAAFLDGFKAGYFHVIVREVDRGGQKLLATTMDMDLTVRRFNDAANMRLETGDIETPGGKVLGVSMRQFLAKQQQMVLTGTVEGDQLHVKVQGQVPQDKKIRWNDKVVGLYRQEQLFRDNKVKPGDSFSYLSYEPTFNTVVNVRVAIKEPEEVEIFKTKKRLLRAEGVPDKIVLQGGGSVQLPKMTWWLDSDLRPVRSQTDLPGLGQIVLYRTSREIALTKGKLPEKMTDIGLTQSIYLSRRIPQPHNTDKIIYRVTLEKDEDPGTAFARDARQEVKNVKDKTFELHVHAVRGPQPTDKPDAKAPEEFLKSNYFLNSADAKVQELARRAVGKETDPWKKAQLIERWVHNNMKALNFTEAMATADHVARTLEGDCSEFSMLAAAMCRAVDVPSRIAIGLVCADLPRGQGLAYHMWTEVWVKGQWVAIDATLGRGSIGAGHLKITDHSWHDVQSMTPLLPVMRVMLAKPKIEVIRVNDRD
jgi:hypothetical protein